MRGIESGLRLNKKPSLPRQIGTLRVVYSKVDVVTIPHNIDRMDRLGVHPRPPVQYLPNRPDLLDPIKVSPTRPMITPLYYQT
ncbi:MAG: hypothetical protein KC462_03270, partial [Cyanobacteria bacterium HKST-UBA05]|nr:hypothetical protein [Cyanobacteria bacterium HKST-UBA05]